MSHAFIEEDCFVTASTRKIHAEPKEISFALSDLKREGFASLDEIAAEYGLSPTMLTNRWSRCHDL